MRVWLFFLYLCCLIIFHLPLTVHVQVTLSSLYAVFQTCLGLPSCCYSFVSSFKFFILGGLFCDFFLCATISSPLAFFSFGRVSSTLGSSSSLLPSCLAAASHGFSQWHPTYAVCGPPPSSHAALIRLLVGSLRCAVAVFLAGHPFLHCLLDFEISFRSVGFSLV